MAASAWRQCCHAAGNWGFGQTYGIVAAGPLREGGHIVEVRGRWCYLRRFLSEYGFFVCRSPDVTIENVRAGTPIVGETMGEYLDVPLVRMYTGEVWYGEQVLPCYVRLVGGPQWVLFFLRKESTEGAYCLISATVEGVDGEA